MSAVRLIQSLSNRDEFIKALDEAEQNDINHFIMSYHQTDTTMVNGLVLVIATFDIDTFTFLLKKSSPWAVNFALQDFNKTTNQTGFSTLLRIIDDNLFLTSLINQSDVISLAKGLVALASGFSIDMLKTNARPANDIDRSKLANTDIYPTLLEINNFYKDPNNFIKKQHVKFFKYLTRELNLHYREMLALMQQMGVEDYADMLRLKPKQYEKNPRIQLWFETHRALEQIILNISNIHPYAEKVALKTFLYWEGDVKKNIFPSAETLFNLRHELERFISTAENTPDTDEQEILVLRSISINFITVIDHLLQFEMPYEQRVELESQKFKLQITLHFPPQEIIKTLNSIFDYSNFSEKEMLDIYYWLSTDNNNFPKTKSTQLELMKLIIQQQGVATTDSVFIQKVKDYSGDLSGFYNALQNHLPQVSEAKHTFSDLEKSAIQDIKNLKLSRTTTVSEAQKTFKTLQNYLNKIDNQDPGHLNQTIRYIYLVLQEFIKEKTHLTSELKIDNPDVTPQLTKYIKEFGELWEENIQDALIDLKIELEKPNNAKLIFKKIMFVENLLKQELNASLSISLYQNCLSLIEDLKTTFGKENSPSSKPKNG